MTRLRPPLAAALLFAVAMGWLAPARAGLNIIAHVGDIEHPSENIVGGGNLTAIFNQAVLNWELAYPDPDQEWTLDLTYHWDELDVSLVAQFSLLTVDENTGRIRSGSIAFNNLNSPQISWFADPNPEIVMGNPAFTGGLVISNQVVVVGGVDTELNVGITFAAAPDSPAYGRSDMLTIAMHEIGHGLGLLYDPPHYEPTNPLVVTEAVSPAYAGYEIYVDRGEHLARPSLMEDKTDLGTRVYPSVNDILAMAVIASYDNPVLNPQNIPGVAVPEPSTLLLSLTGLALLLWRRLGGR
ncbi:MAG: PEP-CTERM sorting domain-containing protein [Chthoniobacterales bacterium]|nr:PEP-CTERM sorting domain-containing protein [Chthoniobacterales bacterium]